MWWNQTNVRTPSDLQQGEENLIEGIVISEFWLGTCRRSAPESTLKCLLMQLGGSVPPQKGWSGICDPHTHRLFHSCWCRARGRVEGNCVEH